MPDTIPAQDLWRDGCFTLARNACLLLRLAGEPVTAENVLSLVGFLTLEEPLQRKSYCNKCLAAAWDAGRPSRELAEYFYYVRDRPLALRRMLEDSVVGVLRGLDLDPPADVPVARGDAPEAA